MDDFPNCNPPVLRTVGCLSLERSIGIACCRRKRSNLSKLADNSRRVKAVHVIRDDAHGASLNYLEGVTFNASVCPFGEGSNV